METSQRWLFSFSLLFVALLFLSFAFGGATSPEERSTYLTIQQLKHHQWELGSIRSYPVPDLPIISPVDTVYPVVSGFGLRIHPILKRSKMHEGIDFAAPTGTVVKATASGVIEKISPLSDSSTFGIHVIILHDSSAFFSGRYRTLYAHLSSVSVKPGQKISAGQMIGRVGSTGRSTSAHLHYEIHFNGEAEDPSHYLRPSAYKADTLLIEPFLIR